MESCSQLSQSLLYQGCFCNPELERREERGVERAQSQSLLYQGCFCNSLSKGIYVRYIRFSLNPFFIRGVFVTCPVGHHFLPGIPCGLNPFFIRGVFVTRQEGPLTLSASSLSLNPFFIRGVFVTRLFLPVRFLRKESIGLNPFFIRGVFVTWSKIWRYIL